MLTIDGSSDRQHNTGAQRRNKRHTAGQHSDASAKLSEVQGHDVGCMQGRERAARLLEGEIIFILVTLRSMISAGRSNSSTMHSGMAPPQGCSSTTHVSYWVRLKGALLGVIMYRLAIGSRAKNLA